MIAQVVVNSTTIQSQPRQPPQFKGHSIFLNNQNTDVKMLDV